VVDEINNASVMGTAANESEAQVFRVPAPERLGFVPVGHGVSRAKGMGKPGQAVRGAPPVGDGRLTVFSAQPWRKSERQ